MGRSIWRLKYISKCTISKIIKESYGISFFKKNSIITNKSSTIPKSLDKILFYLHKGNRYRELKVSKYHIGFKFGEFTLNRKPHVFKKKTKNKETRR